MEDREKLVRAIDDLREAKRSGDPAKVRNALAALDAMRDVVEIEVPVTPTTEYLDALLKPIFAQVDEGPRWLKNISGELALVMLDLSDKVSKLYSTAALYRLISDKELQDNMLNGDVAFGEEERVRMHVAIYSMIIAYVAASFGAEMKSLKVEPPEEIATLVQTLRKGIG